MFQFYVVLDQPKNWHEYVPPWVTAVAAVLAVVGAIVIACKQNSLQKTLAKMQLEQSERQRKMGLFFLRRKVFTDTREFMEPIQRTASAFAPESDEYMKFFKTVQNAEMLFGPEVRKYLKDVNKTTMDLWGSEQRMDKNPGDNNAKEDNDKWFQHLNELWDKINDVFRRDMSLE